MQALESLNDTQVNDFLSGKTPLNLSMRLGDHMMLIQLQLSTANPKPNEVGSSSVPNTTATSSSRSNRSHHHHHHHHSHRIKTCVPQPAPVAHQSSASRKIDVDCPQSSVPLSEADIHRIKNKVNSVNNPLHIATESTSSSTSPPPTTQTIPAVIAAAQPVDLNKNSTTAVVSGEKSNSSSSSYKPLVNTDMEQSPIKSLSNLVSGPIKTTMKNIPSDSNATTTPPPQDNNSSPTTVVLPDPISAKLTSCLCTRLGGKSSDSGCHDTTCNNKPTTNKYVATKIRERRRTIPYGSQPIPSSSSLKQSLYRKMQPQRQQPQQLQQQQPQTSYTPSITTATTTTTPAAEPQAPSITDNMALAEASRNLTQTLRKLSKDVFCHKIDHHQHHSHHHTAAEATSESRKAGSGAVIESMKNHGKGIYSGTFSGTLNPALQDRYGRPKRDISTVIHILNDLLSATPHYTRGAKFSLEPSLNGSSGSTMLHTKYRVCVFCLLFLLWR